MDQLIWRTNFHTPSLIWSTVYTYLKAIAMKWLRSFVNLASRFWNIQKWRDLETSYIKWVIEML